MNAPAAQLATQSPDPDRRFSVALKDAARELGKPERTLRRWAQAQVGDGAKLIAGEWRLDPLRFLVERVPLDTWRRGLRLRAGTHGVTIGFSLESVSPTAARKVTNILRGVGLCQEFAAGAGLRFDGTAARSKAIWERFIRERPETARELKAAGVPMDHGSLVRWIGDQCGKCRGKISTGDVEEARGCRVGRRAEIPTEALDQYNAQRLDTSGFGPTQAARDVSAVYGVDLKKAKTLERRFNEAYPDKRVHLRCRRGEQAMRISLPKIEGRREEYAAGSRFEADGKMHDQLVRLWKNKRWSLVRPEVLYVVCAATRKIVGYAGGLWESGVLLRQALQMAFETHGIPEVIAVDRAEAFNFVEAAKDVLGFRVYRPPPRTPWVRDEGRFNAVKEWDRLSPWYCGGSPEEKPENLERRARENIEDVPEYYSWLRDELPKCVAEVNSRPSDGAMCGGLSPNVAYEQRRVHVRTADPVSVRLALSISCAVERTVTRRGISVHGVAYGGDDRRLWPMLGKRVLALVDPLDMARCTICDRDSKRPLFTTTDRRLTGATADDLRKAKKEVAEYQRAIETIAKSRPLLTASKRQQIAEARRRRQSEQEESMRKALPTPAEPTVSIVLPPMAGDAVAAEAQARGTPRTVEEEQRYLDIEDLPLPDDDYVNPLSRLDFTRDDDPFDAFDDLPDVNDEYQAKLDRGFEMLREECEAAEGGACDPALADDSTSAEDAA
ncbi:MAG: hypothetical protein IT450_16780 [Phycisphaerales bacterium]|nr:hypothetical protein [Phycisphaerales bacterium]